MLAGRVMTADHQEFVLGEWDGVNRSGWDALDDRVIILMEEHVDRTSGGVIIPDSIVERQTLSSEHGILVSIGPGAFVRSDDATRIWAGRTPQVGDRVAIERYSGQLLNGNDGRKYRLMSQRCVGAVVAQEIDRQN